MAELSSPPAPFPPSRVVLRGPLLCDTLGKAELEVAAALLVRACAVLGDRWQPVGLAQVLDVFRSDAGAEGSTWARLASQIALGIVTADWPGLVAGGWARTEGKPTRLELTPKALEHIGAKWCWPPVSGVEAAAGMGWAAADLEPLPPGELGVSSHG
jgi:hypothetical protein